MHGGLAEHLLTYTQFITLSELVFYLDGTLALFFCTICFIVIYVFYIHFSFALIIFPYIRIFQLKSSKVKSKPTVNKKKSFLQFQITFSLKLMNQTWEKYFLNFCINRQFKLLYTQNFKYIFAHKIWLQINITSLYEALLLCRLRTRWDRLRFPIV